MKAIITGANGFVGRYLVEELQDKGYEIWAVIKDENEDISFWKDSDIHIVYCDLADILDLKNRVSGETGGSVFYHLAWAGSSGEARKDYVLQMKNAASCANAVRAAKDLGCARFVGAGSVTEFVYRNYLQIDGTEAEMIACYAIGKLSAEYLARCVCADVGIEYIWAHISNFYGVRDQTNNFINFLVKSYLDGRTPILTAGEQYTDFTYVSDIASALIAAGERGRAGSTYYVGYGKPRPLKEFVLDVKNAIDPALDAGLGKKEFLALPIDYTQIDVDKLHRETGFVPDIPFSRGIHNTIEWIKESR